MTQSTRRLNIRPYKPSDCEAVYEIYRNEKTCRYLLHEPWTSASKDEAFQKKLKANQLTEDTAISLACELDQTVIGDISIAYTEMRDTVEIGYVFNEKCSGKGYATEALNAVIDYLFNGLNIHRIQANLDARNQASAKLCERVGMRQEAHFIQDYWNKGQWTDSFVYGMLQSDFKKAAEQQGGFL